MSDIVAQLTDTRYPGQLEMRFEAAAEINRLRSALHGLMEYTDDGLLYRASAGSKEGWYERGCAVVKTARDVLAGLPFPTDLSRKSEDT